MVLDEIPEKKKWGPVGGVRGFSFARRLMSADLLHNVAKLHIAELYT